MGLAEPVGLGRLLVSLSGLPWAPADASDWGSLRPPLTSDRWSVPSTLHASPSTRACSKSAGANANTSPAHPPPTTRHQFVASHPVQTQIRVPPPSTNSGVSLRRLTSDPPTSGLFPVSSPRLKFSRISDSMALIIFEIQIAARVESAEPLLPWASPTRRIGETHCLPSPCLLVSLSGLPWAPADASDWGSLRPPLTSDRWSVPSTLHLRL
jgi:hypothetical protein